MSGKILPKWVAKGIDFCGTSSSGFYYIVRSDLGVYLRSTNFNEGNQDILELHDACKDGDHYLSVPGSSGPGWFYIIKGNEYRKVSSLDTDDDAEVWPLHENCRGGTHYFGGPDHYKYIIFAERNKYRRVTDMTDDLKPGEFDLHPECQGGLYYWACGDYKYFLKQGNWGIEYHRVTDLTENKSHEFWSMHKTIVNFLPGGLAINIGPSYGKWTLLKSISNDTNTKVTWQKKITKKVGYAKEQMKSIEHNWNISASVSVSSGGLTKLIAEAQFSLSAAYGGSQVETNKENWTEAREVEETIGIILNTNETAYVWQYQLGLGEKPLLFCRNVAITKTSSPPAYPGIKS